MPQFKLTDLFVLTAIVAAGFGILRSASTLYGSGDLIFSPSTRRPHPGQARSAENVRHDLRRILRNDGMLMVSKPRPARVKQPSRIELLERRLAEVLRRAQVLEDLVRSVTVGGARP